MVSLFIRVQIDIDINRIHSNDVRFSLQAKFPQLIPFIKNLLQTQKFVVKKAKIFEEHQQIAFLKLADNSDHVLQLKMVRIYFDF